MTNQRAELLSTVQMSEDINVFIRKPVTVHSNYVENVAHENMLIV